MKIGEIIKSSRKKENLTQEQVAKYLNISAPAVNKWENGVSYPDITLLAPLARVLGIDVNTLLAFNEELTTSDVNRLGREVGDLAAKEGFEAAFERGKELIKQYSGCDELIIRVASLLRLFLVTKQVAEKEKYEDKIITWIELVANGDNEKTSSMAKITLSAIYRERSEYKKAKDILETIPAPTLSIEKQIQQILLCEEMEEFDEGYCICEDILFSAAHESMGALYLIIEMLLKEDKYSEAAEYVERAKKLVDVFDLSVYNKFTLDLRLAKYKKDKDKAIELIIDMKKNAETMDNINSELYKHRKWKINNSWSKERYENLVKKTIKGDKELDFIKDDPRIKSIIG